MNEGSKDLSRTAILHNRTRPETPALTVGLCRSYLCRLRGLMFRPTLPPEWGLLLVQGRSSRMDAAVHMLWMRFDLAIVWLDENLTVVDVRPARRWQPFLMPAQPARYILETDLRYLERYAIGDALSLEEIPPAV